MADYSLTSDVNLVLRNTDGAWIPRDERNVDWTAYQAWLDAGNTPDAAPPPVIQVSFLEFMALFTQQEQVAIISSTDAQIKLFVTMATGAGRINLSDDVVVQGVQYAVSQNLITADRAVSILAGQSPT